MRRLIKRVTMERIVEEEEEGCGGPSDPDTEDDLSIPAAETPTCFPPAYRNPSRVVINWFRPTNPCRALSMRTARLAALPTVRIRSR